MLPDCRPSYHLLEIEYGPFERRIALPETSIPTGPATYERGLLTVVLPVVATPPRTERITIRIRTIGVSDQMPEAEPFEGDVEIPSALPVLPLKETVVFPQSMTPLAIGQERSVKLIDDVVAGDRMLALVTTRDPEVEQAGFDDVYEIGTAGLVHRMIRSRTGRSASSSRALRGSASSGRVTDDPYPIGEFVEAAGRRRARARRSRR